MASKDSAKLACADANPIIDGRKANVNLAIIGAKPRNNATQNTAEQIQFAIARQQQANQLAHHHAGGHAIPAIASTPFGNGTLYYDDVATKAQGQGRLAAQYIYPQYYVAHPSVAYQHQNQGYLDYSAYAYHQHLNTASIDPYTYAAGQGAYVPPSPTNTTFQYQVPQTGQPAIQPAALPVSTANIYQAQFPAGQTAQPVCERM